MKKQSKLPMPIKTVAASRLAESIGRKPEAVATPKSITTVAKSDPIQPKNIQTASKQPKPNKVAVGKNINNIQNKVDPKLDCYGDRQKSMLGRKASLLKLKRMDNKATLNYLSKRSKTCLGLRSTETCRATTPGPLNVQVENAPISKNQMRTNIQGCDGIRQRASEKSKFQLFQYAKDELLEVQTKVMVMCDNLKLKGSYKFISLVQNENCNLIVNKDCLERMPENIPRESVNDFRETVQEAVFSCLDIFDNHFTDHKIPENETNWLLDCESLRKKLKQHLEIKLEALRPRIDALCKHPPNNQTELTRALEELQETKRGFEEFKVEKDKEILGIIAQHKLELATEIKNREDGEAKVQLLEEANKNLKKSEKDLLEKNCMLKKFRASETGVLGTRVTELSAETERLKFQIFEKNSQIAQMEIEKNNRAEEFHRVVASLLDKEKEIHKLQHTNKLQEECAERNLKLIEELKQDNADLNKEIARHKVRECKAYQKVAERMKFIESSDDSEV